MKVEILGTGCKRCDQLYENAKAASAALNPRAAIEVVKVGDIAYFSQKGVFMTPGLLIDGQVVSVGKVLTVEEIRSKLEEKL